MHNLRRTVKEHRAHPQCPEYPTNMLITSRTRRFYELDLLLWDSIKRIDDSPKDHFGQNNWGYRRALRYDIGDYGRARSID